MPVARAGPHVIWGEHVRSSLRVAEAEWRRRRRHRTRHGDAARRLRRAAAARRRQRRQTAPPRRPALERHRSRRRASPTPGGKHHASRSRPRPPAAGASPRRSSRSSGIQVARSIYDTSTVPNDKGDYVPYLADTITPNADYTTWTIHLRPGIKFHDGTAAQRAGRQGQPRRLPRQVPDAARRCCSRSCSPTSRTSRSSTR